MKKLLISLGLLALPLFAQIEGDLAVPDIDYPAPKAKGVNTYQANCMMCHSLGYIKNQGLQPKSFWQEKVDKMRNAFKAPITDRDAKEIVEYLNSVYGLKSEKKKKK